MSFYGAPFVAPTHSPYEATPMLYQQCRKSNERNCSLVPRLSPRRRAGRSREPGRTRKICTCRCLRIMSGKSIDLTSL